MKQPDSPLSTPADSEAVPASKFKITFRPGEDTIEAGEVDPTGHHEGEPGSILDWADQHDIEIEHACGGFAACSTCHVIVREGLDSCNEASEEEEDMLDEAPGLTLQSRLACQCIPDGSQDLVVEIPAWNRNLVKEGAH
ncbi:MAG: 2Fe-2S iron-sulfur cluster-binding protein [SAR324 cluster bacterium]|nr:2Fe-2S iron-sulfur cluster-binding protein [SAR324 cluster bacterium]MCZ6557713.1 2Fe-2S iron-sulfur cluster-binding protein [SAR324 cluster bacterium]MCZ6627104.1 2Fe-2S iron-sulfur cluster-binding protein [SAR324 cluster bacterium]MCZ6645794.1 2Fe-2S iron-sulfur cluster-binding protein [SAR324 cluster bacterium]